MLEWVLDVSQIIIADIVLSGDNALIIGMAASAVPEESRKKVIFIGLMAAAVLRVLFALVASYLISIPGLLLLGGILLFWVCWKFYGDIKEFSSNDEDKDKLKKNVSGKGMKAALITIIIADVSIQRGLLNCSYPLDSFMVPNSSPYSHRFPRSYPSQSQGIYPRNQP